MKIVVTGAGRGLGASLVQQSIAARHNVIGIDRLFQKGSLGRPWSYDLACRDDQAEIISRLSETGPADIFIHNAGISATGLFERIPMTDHQSVIDVNLTAPLLLTTELLKNGLIAEHGTLVFVASLSCYTGYPGASVYAATKDGLAHFARSIAPDCQKAGIKCLTVFPGPMRTDHAQHHAPSDSSETARTAPEAIATQILNTVLKERQLLIPGWRMQAAAALGKLAPSLAERLMRRTVLLKLGTRTTGPLL